jgi:hypothetical protein
LLHPILPADAMAIHVAVAFENLHVPPPLTQKEVEG